MASKKKSAQSEQAAVLKTYIRSAITARTLIKDPKFSEPPLSPEEVSVLLCMEPGEWYYGLQLHKVFPDFVTKTSVYIILPRLTELGLLTSKEDTRVDEKEDAQKRILYMTTSQGEFTRRAFGRAIAALIEFWNQPISPIELDLAPTFGCFLFGYFIVYRRTNLSTHKPEFLPILERANMAHGD